MAKRTRGSSRPGQRHSHTPTRPQVKPAGLSAAEVAHAAELEGQILEQENAARAAAARPNGRGRDAALPAGLRPRQSPLALRAAEEYAYVTRDVRRIITVGGAMVAILAVLVILIDVLHVVTV
jgi:hypothetical protein